MRNTDCYRLAKILLPSLPGFVTNKKNEIFISPIGDVFRGFMFESTAGSREDFYFWWFFMPMAPATDHYRLSHGNRLIVPGGHTGWRTDVENLREKLLQAMNHEALPLLQSITTNRAAIEAIQKLYYPGPVDYIHPQNDIACLLLLDGQVEEARLWIEKIIANENGTDKRQWVMNIVDRTKKLRALLEKDPVLALERVRQWRDYSFKELKLENWK